MSIEEGKPGGYALVAIEMSVPPLSDPKKKKRGLDDSPSIPSVSMVTVKRQQPAKNPVYGEYLSLIYECI